MEIEGLAREQSQQQPSFSGMQAVVQTPDISVKRAPTPKNAYNEAAGINPVPETEAKEKGVSANQAVERTEIPAEDDAYNRTMTEKAVENANQRVKAMGTDAKFSYNKEINRITITITDRASNEVIKEIPPEETQKMLERIHTMTGMIMDAEA